MMVNAHHHNSGLASWSSSSRAFSALHLTTWQASTCNLHIFLLGLVLFFLALLEARSVYGGLIQISLMALFVGEGLREFDSDKIKTIIDTEITYTHRQITYFGNDEYMFHSNLLGCLIT